MVFNIEPLVSIGAAAVLLSERLEPNQYAGGALVLFALALAGKAARRSNAKSRE
jgi:drug/metabolite transporter (DMT)-like permease